MATLLGSHALFLAAAVATHAALGAALGATAFDRPLAGAVGGVLADSDFLFPATAGFPLVHRGITHTALALALLAAAVWLFSREAALVGGVSLGYGSHLAVDAATPTGVPLAYPVSPASVGVDLGGHSPAGTALLWALAAALLWRRRARAAGGG